MPTEDGKAANQKQGPSADEEATIQKFAKQEDSATVTEGMREKWDGNGPEAGKPGKPESTLSREDQSSVAKAQSQDAKQDDQPTFTTDAETSGAAGAPAGQPGKPAGSPDTDKNLVGAGYSTAGAGSADGGVNAKDTTKKTGKL